MENENQAEALRRRVESERTARRAGKSKYSDELKRDVLELLARDGWGIARVSRAVGLATSVVYRWSVVSGGAKPKQAQRAVPQMKRVRVVAEARPTEATFVLTFPSGASVAGLTFVDVLQLARGEQ